MPRITEKKNEYVVSDFTRKVKGKCAERDIPQYQLADVLGITAQAMGQKMKKGTYSFMDFLIIKDYLKFTDEELMGIMR